jgi:uncharacterized membrane protein YphA (DoxX/SURF4 family)
MKYLSILSRLILGTVFIFSGFVKAVDPLGSAYKFADYFSAFKLEFLSFISMPLAVLLSAFELVLGLTLILGYRRRIIYRVVLWFMAFFTLLTFILAIFNPVTDCGCFGDAIILTNWQTFLKNVILMIFILPLFLLRNKDERPESRPVREWGVIAVLFLLVSGFSLWNNAHLPMLDFRPYDVGTVIREEMEVPEGAEVDEYETELIYRNRESGKTEKFTIDNYPKDTTRWVFESSDSRLLSKGYAPPIHDFAIMDESGWDLVDQILADNEYSLIMISQNLSEADESALRKARDWSQLEMMADDFSFYAVTSTPSEEVNSISSSLDLGYSFYSADEIMLKTMVRSNPGFILIRNGVIVDKWGFRDFPAVEELDPEWTEMIGNAAVPVDEETQMLIEAGVFEEFSFDVIDFDHLISKLVYKQSKSRQERGVVVVFILGAALLLLLSHHISPIRG